MVSEALEENLSDLNSKREQLKCGIKLANFAITEHFLTVKRDIDTQTENLINRINEKRAQLFDEIDSYEKETLARFMSNFDENDFGKILEESKNFAEKCTQRQVENELEAKKHINVHLKQIEESLQKFEIMKFSNNLMVFEKSLDVCLNKTIDRLFGALIFKPISNDKIIKSNKLNGVKYDFLGNSLLPVNKLCDPGPTVLHTDCSEFLKLSNGKYVHTKRYYRRNLRIGVYSNDFTQLYVSLNLIKDSIENFSVPCVCVHGDKFVLCLEDHSKPKQPRTLVLVFDEHLNLIREALIDGVHFRVVANASHLVFLSLNTVMNRIIVNVYDWTGLFEYEIDSDDLQSRYTLRHVELDDSNRLILQFRDAFHVVDLSESKKTIRKHFLKMEIRRKSTFITFKVYDSSTLCLLESPATLVFINFHTCEVVWELRVDLDLETGNLNSQYGLKILDINRDQVVLFEPVSNSVQVFKINESDFKI
jgi:hypothetical protein